jgi:hypothetical protein
LTFSANVPPRQYFLTAFLFYRGDDWALRLYNSLYLDPENTSVEFIAVDTRGGSTLIDIALRLNENAYVCAVRPEE